MSSASKENGEGATSSALARAGAASAVREIVGTGDLQTNSNKSSASEGTVTPKGCELGSLKLNLASKNYL